jgi:hypothetical protein
MYIGVDQIYVNFDEIIQGLRVDMENSCNTSVATISYYFIDVVYVIRLIMWVHLVIAFTPFT